MRSRLLLLTMALMLVLAACGSDDNEASGGSGSGQSKDTGKISILTAMEPEESDALQGVVDDALDGKVEYQPTFEASADFEQQAKIRVEGGNPPDLAMYPQPGTVVELAKSGKAIALEDMGFDIDELKDLYGDYFLSLGEYNGKHYGMPTNINLKSMVWYPKDDFDKAGYKVPKTWDELIALSDQIVADGNGNPWCISIESQEADGWVATDWMEDILLRTAPPETYNQWISHEIPFNDPEVLEAAELMSQIWFTPDYAYGGNTYINATWIGETQDPMFAEGGPQCWMQKQAAWIGGFWGANRDALADDPNLPADQWPVKPQTDVDFFYFPQIEEEFGTPVLGAADMFVMFEDRPEVRALMEWLATPDAAAGWIERGGFLSPLTTVPSDWYVYPNTQLSEMVAGATTVGFDASDLMPAEVGAGTFWSGMVDWVAANGEGTEEIFQSIEDSWPAG
jgi:alpha-glucoside transport system substrate-binding protein